MTAPSFSLDPDLDVAALRRAFAAAGRVQIAPFLAPHCAEALHKAVSARQDWQLAMNASGKQALNFDRAKWDWLSEAQRGAFLKAAEPRDAAGFRYTYDQIAVVREGPEPVEPGTLLGAFAAFLSSQEAKSFFTAVTGFDDFAYADAQATRYRPGHFLTVHSDSKASVKRRAGYVLGLTPQWRPEWGGLLLFHDAQGDVNLGLLPRFNTLNLFAVPQPHSVSHVAPYAAAMRYSITGWLIA